MTSKETKLIGIVLAAGRGSRLSPLTDLVPKPLLKFNGKTFLEHSLETLEYSGAKHIKVVVGYRSAQVIDFIKKRDSKSSFSYVRQENLLGSANALSCALLDDLRTSTDYSEFCIIASDYVIPKITITRMLQHLKDSNYDGIILTTFEDHTAAQKSSVVIRIAGAIQRIEEKPDLPKFQQTYETCKLCYILRSNCLDSLVIQSSVYNGKEESIPDRLNMMIEAGYRFTSLSLTHLPDADSLLL